MKCWGTQPISVLGVQGKSEKTTNQKPLGSGLCRRRPTRHRSTWRRSDVHSWLPLPSLRAKTTEAVKDKQNYSNYVELGG